MVSEAARDRDAFADHIVWKTITPKPVWQISEQSAPGFKVNDPPVAVSTQLASKPANTVSQHQAWSGCVNHVQRADPIFGGVIQNTKGRDNQTAIKSEAAKRKQGTQRIAAKLVQVFEVMEDFRPDQPGDCCNDKNIPHQFMRLYINLFFLLCFARHLFCLIAFAPVSECSSRERTNK